MRSATLLLPPTDIAPRSTAALPMHPSTAPPPTPHPPTLLSLKMRDPEGYVSSRRRLGRRALTWRVVPEGGLVISREVIGQDQRLFRGYWPRPEVIQRNRRHGAAECAGGARLPLNVHGQGRAPRDQRVDPRAEQRRGPLPAQRMRGAPLNPSRAKSGANVPQMLPPGGSN